jgi:hypothetical protein
MDDVDVSRGDFVAGGGCGGDFVRGDRAVASDVRTRAGMTLFIIGAPAAGEWIKPIAIAVLMVGIVLASWAANRR